VISASGTWGTLFGSNAYFVSDEPWSLSFDVSSSPAPFTSNPGVSFSVFYTNGMYTLHGVTVALPQSTATFFEDQSFALCLDTGCFNDIITFNGSAPLFTGPTSSSTFDPPGNYPTDPLGGFNARGYVGGPFEFGDTGTLGDTNIALLAPAGAGLLLAGCIRGSSGT